ncbi:MAG: hypothetical protein NT137_01365 [Methanomassiliicoccales archaeon]|nr:hypothetical protein [Methanomassiliicoccales archaeon]
MVFSIALEAEEIQELKDTAKRMALPPSVYARSLLLRALRDEIAAMDEAEKARPAGVG